MNADFQIPEHLEGNTVRIERLGETHADRLLTAGNEPSIWTWMARPPLVTHEDALDYIAVANAPSFGEGPQVPYAVIHQASGDVAGSTRLMDLRPDQGTGEIGWTWYHPRYQRTAVNTETKLLLLTCAFEQLGMVRLQFKTDSQNLRSQQALDRLGATREGTLRNHRVRPDGTLRHSVHYSITPDEWPTIKAHLTERLARG